MKTSAKQDWFETPLFYDIIYDADTRTEAKFLSAVYERFATPKKGAKPPVLLEPACGSGRLVRGMIWHGWECWGFDFKNEMLAFARKRLANKKSHAHLWQDQMQSFKVPARKRFDLAHCLINSMRYLRTEKEARGFLQRVAQSLRPGGVFVLGMHLTDYTRSHLEHERWVMKRKGMEVVCNTRTWPANRRSRCENLRTRLLITHRGERQKQETLWTYRTYSASQLRAILKIAAPELKIVAHYDFNYDLEMPRALDDEYADIVVVLQKKF